MLTEEINNLLSTELEMIKEITSIENHYVNSLKKLELDKERMLEENTKKAHKAVEDFQKKEKQIAQKKVKSIEKEYQERHELLKKKLSRKKKKISKLMLELVKKEVKYVYSTESV